MDTKLLRTAIQFIAIITLIEGIDFIDRKYVHFGIFEWNGKKTLGFMVLLIFIVKLYVIPNELKRFEEEQEK